VRVFLAGATGVIGIRLIPLLVDDGHVVAGLTRSATMKRELVALNAEPVVCDVFNLEELTAVLASWTPDVEVDQLTDLPDRIEQLGDFSARNDRIRTEGTRNLVAAARAGGARHFSARQVGSLPSSTTTRSSPNHRRDAVVGKREANAL
jgi:nucleoside-diphosphate-sugar epimerase